MKYINLILILICSIVLSWCIKNDNSIIKIPHTVRQTSLIHTTGSLHFDEMYFCSDEQDDIELYKKLSQEWKKCKNNFPTTITCDMQCADITWIVHNYTIPERNLSFTLQYDKRTSAYDFLQQLPKNYLFSISGDVLTEDIKYDTSSIKNTIIYTQMNIPYTTILDGLKSKWYVVEDYSTEIHTTDENIIAYLVSDRLIVNDTMPDERIYVFNKSIIWYFYNMSKDILSYDCNPWPCSSFSNIKFFIK
jgi:hypothetical protein